MYERVGGGPAVRQVVDQLYGWIMIDEQLRPYFDGVALGTVKGHMAALLSQVLGGPSGYTGRDLAEAHRPLNVTDPHYTRVADLAAAALLLAHAPRDIVEAVASTLEQLRTEIVAAGAAPGQSADAGQRPPVTPTEDD